MRAYQVHVLNSFLEVESLSRRWDDLWRRSDITIPTLRVELLRNWLLHFTPDQPFRAIVVEQGNDLVAALPLVGRRLGKLIPAGGLPCNEWSGAGDLMLDPAADGPSVLRVLATTLNRLAWPLYRFSYIRTDRPAWKQFFNALQASRTAVECRPSFEVKYIHIRENWEAYRQTISSNLRQRMSRMLRRISELGEITFQRHTPQSFTEAEPLILAALQIEDQGWKGRSGTSLLRSPGMAEHLLRTCELLVPNRELEVAFLALNGQKIAFQILWKSKNVLHGYKGSYDEQYQRFSPGQLLIHELLRDACETQHCQAYDCLGPNIASLSQWSGTTYRVGQMTVARRNWIGNALLSTYRFCRPGRGSFATPSAIADFDRSQEVHIS